MCTHIAVIELAPAEIDRQRYVKSRFHEASLLFEFIYRFPVGRLFNRRYSGTAPASVALVVVIVDLAMSGPLETWPDRGRNAIQ